MKKYRWYFRLDNAVFSNDWIPSIFAPDFEQLKHIFHDAYTDIYKGVNGFFWKRETYYEVSEIPK